MARAKTPDTVIDAVLLKARRRCCICFGLQRDTSLKSGQIAHLDRDSANNREDNLAFLCLDHHDEYDSRTSQRKGLTSGEVKAFREELSLALDVGLLQQVHFGSLGLPEGDPIAGQYIRMGTGNDSAQVEFTPLPDGIEGTPRYFVSGLALWGTDRKYGPNIGDCGFVVEMDHHGRGTHYGPSGHAITVRFDQDILFLIEEGQGSYGANVTFDGTYRRAR